MNARRSLSLLLSLAASACGDPPGAVATDTGTTSDPVLTTITPVPPTGDPDGTADSTADTADTTDTGDDPSPPARAWQSEVIYLVMPDRFVDGDPTNDTLGAPDCFDPADPRKYHGGDLAGLRSRIDYLAELGVTAVWITPMYAQSPDRCGYHGYWADFADPDDGATYPSLGTVDDLRDLADALHQADMRLVLDMVVNHSGPQARVFEQHPEWFHDPDTCASLGPAEVYCWIGGKPLPDFAQEDPDVAAYLSAVTVGWLERAPIDGIRMDTVKHVYDDYWAGSWFPAVRGSRPDTFVVGEVFDTESTTRLDHYLDVGFDSMFDFPLMASLVDVVAAGHSVDGLAARVEDQLGVLGQERLRALTTFIDNHDLPRFASVSSAGESETSQLRLREALALLMTLPGIPMLYYGDELGLLGGADPDNRRDMPGWAFDPAQRGQPHPGQALPHADDTFAWTQSLIALRREHPALVEGDYVELWRKGGQPHDIFGFVRTDGVDPLVVLVNNEDTEAGPIAIRIAANEALSEADHARLSEGATLVELLGSDAPDVLTIVDGKLGVTLPPHAVGVYRVGR